MPWRLFHERRHHRSFRATNSGKSTLFNALTGARQHVGNWPGKTVEKKEGQFTKNGKKYTVTDLPGTYSLSANSDEEIVTRDYIAGGKADVVCILADASQLERSLFMLADYAGIDCPAILLLNLMDVAQDQGKSIDAGKIEDRLGIPVIPFVAADKKNYQCFYDAIDQALQTKRELAIDELEEKYGGLTHGLYSQFYALMPKDGIAGYSPLWLAAKVLEGDAKVTAEVKEHLTADEERQLNELITHTENGVILTGDAKFQWIDTVLQGAVSGQKQSPTLTKFDKLATSKRWGKVIAVGIILLGLMASFIPAAPVMMIGSMIPNLGVPISAGLASLGVSQFLIDLIAHVFLNVISFTVSMIGFVFSVNLVFGLIEEVGYMARVSYVFDSTMAKLGLQGKAVMPFLVSLGCTMGGTTGTRVIDSWGQKVLTITLAWAVPCAATWSIVPVLSGVFFGVWAPVIILLIFAIMILHMFITAKVFGPKLVKDDDRAGIIMELPPYHKPKWGTLLRSVFARTGDIFTKAFKVILIISLLFWLLTYSSSGVANDSLLYRFGNAIEPVTQFFGMNWQLFLAFISSAVSKEAALGVLSTLYAGTGSLFSSTLEGAAIASNFNELLLSSITQPQALAFIFAVTFNAPCLMAVSSTYQETHSLKWTVSILAYYMLTALLISFVIFHLASLFL